MRENRLEKIKQIRSLNEVMTRSGQALSVYREQRRGGPDIPSDEEFVRLIDAAQFGKAPIIAESLWQRFYKNGQKRFFPAFSDPENAAGSFRKIFGDSTAEKAIAGAKNIVRGRIDLLGLKNLDIGIDVDWNCEPLSRKRSPLMHWRAYEALGTADTGDKKIIWELNRHQHFFTLGLAFCRTGDERFGETFARHLESWMEQNPPGLGINWSSSLEISLRAISWIWAFHFFKNSDHFTPELFKKALKYLYLQGRHVERYLSTYYSPNTHLTGEALGLYYLGTQFPYFRRANEWRKLGEDILFSEIEKQILPNGVYFEQSTWYQRYTVEFYAQFLILRSLSEGKDPKTVRIENRLQKALDFLMHITLPDGRTPLIGDDDGGRLLPLTHAAPDDFRGSLALGAAMFDRGDLKYVAGAASGEIFWLLGKDGIDKYGSIDACAPKETSKSFSEGGYYVMRDGFDSTDNCLIVDCGEVGSLSGGHGHADALAIELAIQGETLLVDSGTYTYHESNEMRDQFRSSAAHNTLVVDGLSSSEPGNTFSWNTRAECVRKNWISEDRFDLFEGSHNGYERLANPVTHTRSILYIKGDYWIVRDIVETTGEHDYSLNFHYSPSRDLQIAENGVSVGDDIHRMSTFGENGEWHRSDSFVSNNHASKADATLMSFQSKGIGTQEFFTFILPLVDDIAPEISEMPTTSGRAFEIKYALYKDVFVFNDEPGKRTELDTFVTDFRFSWLRFSEDETLPDECVVVDGRYFKIGRNEIFGSARLPFASARRLGSDLYVGTDKGRRKVSLATTERRQYDRRSPSSDRRRHTR